MDVTKEMWWMTPDNKVVKQYPVGTFRIYDWKKEQVPFDGLRPMREKEWDIYDNQCSDFVNNFVGVMNDYATLEKANDIHIHRGI